MQYFVPLQLGVVCSILWANLNYESYEKVFGSLPDTNHWQIGSLSIHGHPLTIHFIVNEVFMVFFFGVVMVEVTTAVTSGMPSERN